jgi:KaiC/GvpD/RAD55 family RecA-like ATPase
MASSKKEVIRHNCELTKFLLLKFCWRFPNESDNSVLVVTYSWVRRRGFSLVSLTQLQEVPSKNMILLVGPPGSGKSTFCQQAILQGLTVDRPVIYLTTEYDQSEAIKRLREMGLGEVEPGLMSFVDAYTKTVGISVCDRPDTVFADCNSLSSLDVAISKVAFMLGVKGGLLVFDSLTSPYLFNGSEVLRFMRRSLSKVAAQGHAVLVCIDEGCCRSEDLVAMMSLASGVIKIEVQADKQIFSVIKHPVLDHVEKMEVSLIKQEKIWDPTLWDKEKVKVAAFEEGKMRKKIEIMLIFFGPLILSGTVCYGIPNVFLK